MFKTAFRFAFISLFIGPTLAFGQKTLTCGGTDHTVHVVTTNKSATCVLSKLYETEDFCMADVTNKNIEGQAMSLSPTQSFSFGMVITGNADFNMEYSLTCVVNDGAMVQSPKVVFIIGADGPADPNISVVNLYGAQGSWVTTGSGENYSLVF